MMDGRRVLAVVPARSGSKGIPHKNLRTLRGRSLIGWAGRTLARLPFVDRRVISTDSPEYAREGEHHGLDAPFLRPAELSGDRAGAVETMQHAVREMEARDATTYDVVLIVEPTSPFRVPDDVERCARRLLEPGVDSAVTVSELPTKAHPHKVLRLDGDNLTFYESAGRAVVARQTLAPLYFRNGVCYALTRRCLMELGAIFGPVCRAEVTRHAVANIDEEWELEWAEWQLSRGVLDIDGSGGPT
jgi:CMP-N-acetylneuraminic acid synthetase